VDRTPAGDGLEVDDRPAGAPGDPLEVVVVAGDPQRPADRRVDQAVGLGRGQECCGDRLGEQLRDRSVASGSSIGQAQLAVRPEAAVRPVDVVEESLDGQPGRLERIAVDEQVDVRPERPPGSRPDDGYDPPVETWPPPVVVVAFVVAGRIVAVGVGVAAAVVEFVVDEEEVVVVVPTSAAGSEVWPE